MVDVSISNFQVGATAVRFITPHFVEMDLMPPFSGAHARQLLDLLQEIRLQHGPCLVLADVSKLGQVPRDVRENAVVGDKNYDAIKALAVVGASFGVRVVVNMLLTANRLLSSNPKGYPVGFFDNKVAALAWLNAQTNQTLL